MNNDFALQGFFYRIFTTILISLVLLKNNIRPLKSVAEDFQGLHLGGVIGLGDASYKDSFTKIYKAFNGRLSGIYFGCGFDYGGLYLGLDITHTKTLFPTSQSPPPFNTELSHKSSIDFGGRIGLGVQDRFLPFIKAGYAINKLRSPSGKYGILDSAERTFSPLIFGAGIDTKVFSRLILGLEALITSAHTQDSTTARFHTVRLRIAAHL